MLDYCKRVGAAKGLVAGCGCGRGEDTKRRRWGEESEPAGLPPRDPGAARVRPVTSSLVRRAPPRAGMSCEWCGRALGEGDWLTAGCSLPECGDLQYHIWCALHKPALASDARTSCACVDAAAQKCLPAPDAAQSWPARRSPDVFVLLP